MRSAGGAYLVWNLERERPLRYTGAAMSENQPKPKTDRELIKELDDALGVTLDKNAALKANAGKARSGRRVGKL